jgi:hypothetical protein
VVGRKTAVRQRLRQQFGIRKIMLQPLLQGQQIWT